MDVLIVGAHGTIGQRLSRRTAASEHRSRAMVRDAALTLDSPTTIGRHYEVVKGDTPPGRALLDV